MNYNDQHYHDMRDQYLELLWAAQKVENCRLTEMILQRLEGYGHRDDGGAFASMRDCSISKYNWMSMWVQST